MVNARWLILKNHHIWWWNPLYLMGWNPFLMVHAPHLRWGDDNYHWCPSLHPIIARKYGQSTWENTTFSTELQQELPDSCVPLGFQHHSMGISPTWPGNTNKNMYGMIWVWIRGSKSNEYHGWHIKTADADRYGCSPPYGSSEKHRFSLMPSSPRTEVKSMAPRAALVWAGLSVHSTDLQLMPQHTAKLSSCLHGQLLRAWLQLACRHLAASATKL